MDLSERDFVWPFEDRLPPGDPSIFANYKFGGLDVGALMSGTDPATPENTGAETPTESVWDKAVNWATGGNKNYMAGGEPVEEPPLGPGGDLAGFGDWVGRGTIIILGFIFTAIGLSMFRPRS